MKTSAWQADAGTYDLMLGDSSQDIQQKSTLQLSKPVTTSVRNKDKGQRIGLHSSRLSIRSAAASREESAVLLQSGFLADKSASE